MQDRVPTHPGRVTLTPVSGQANTYDMVRADSPTQEGTPLNKNNLLKDSTAALYGLGSDAVPDEVLAKAKELIAANSTAIANGVKIATGSYVGTGTYGSSNPCSLTFDFVPKLLLVDSVCNDNSTSVIGSCFIVLLDNLSSTPTAQQIYGCGHAPRNDSTFSIAGLYNYVGVGSPDGYTPYFYFKNNALYWYSEKWESNSRYAQARQCNVADVYYIYRAFG